MPHRENMVKKIAKSDSTYIGGPQVCLRYNGMSHMWLRRKLESDPTFPKPYRFGNSRKYWKVEELESWERTCVVKSRASRAA